MVLRTLVKKYALSYYGSLQASISAIVECNLYRCLCINIRFETNNDLSNRPPHLEAICCSVTVVIVLLDFSLTVKEAT